MSTKTKIETVNVPATETRNQEEKTMENKFKKIPAGRFRMASKCYSCSGTGLNICPKCNGNKTFNGKPCPDCKARGVVDCYRCKGRGIIDD